MGLILIINNMNWTFIYNETLQWVIDGVNVTFTTLHNIDKIEEVYYLWAVYRDVSFVGNVVIFATAPIAWTSSPTIDYFKEELSPLTPSSDVTFLEVQNDIYEKIYWQTIAEWADTTGPFKLTQIKMNINNGLNRIKNLRTYKDKVFSYSFNKAKDLSAIWYNASYVEVWTGITNIPASWLYILKDSIPVTYTSYASWRLNWTVGVIYENADKVILWYKIPSWVKKVSEVIVNWCPLEYIDTREFSIGYSNKYTIIKVSNWDEYIFLPYSVETDVIVTVKYIPTTTTLVDNSDIVDIEREYFEILSYYTLYKMYRDREDDRWQYAYDDYEKLLREYKSYKSRAVDWINNTMKSNILTDF